MSKAYGAALRDYPRRVRFPLALLLSFILLVVAVEGRLKGKEWAGEAGFLITGMLLMLWTGLVSGHLKQVLARPEGRLSPRFGQIHLRVALLLVSPALLLAIGGALLAGLSPVAALAVPLLVFSIYWSWPYFVEHGNMLMLFGPTLFFWISTLTDFTHPPGWDAWIEFSRAESAWWLLAIVFSLALTAFTILRMLRLNESSFEYRYDPSICWRSGSSPDSDTPFLAFFQHLLPWLGRYSLRSRHSVFASGNSRRIAHWRRGMGPRSPIVSGLAMALMTALVGIFFLFYRERSTHAEAGILLVYMIILPFNRIGHTQRRRRYFEKEALFPVRRERLVRELGMATAIDVVLSWLTLCVGIVALRALGLFATVSWAWIPYLVLLSLGTTILGIGFSPWTLRLDGDKWPVFLLSMLVLLAGGVTALVLRSLSGGFARPEIWLAATLLLAMPGVGLAYLGYRQWGELELGRSDLW